MRILLIGTSCVGKSTIGRLLAKKLNYNFFDFDEEISKYFGMSIEAIQNKYISMSEYRKHCSVILQNILDCNKDNIVVAMTPSGLCDFYLKIIKKTTNVFTILLKDKPVNIVKRLIFTDYNDRLITKTVVTKENEYMYLQKIREDIEYFRSSYKRANMKFDINGKNEVVATEKLFDEITDNNTIFNR